MMTSIPDIKKLWGLAAGRCSAPSCHQKCIGHFSEDEPTVLGEMAHVIPKSATGPRGDGKGGDDTYENLILLCPVHHREIDKAPDGTFSVELLYEWKQDHEEKIAKYFTNKNFGNIEELSKHIKRLMIQNKQIWMQYGPESITAQNNPVSSAHQVWVLRKLNTIVPNNRKIINIIKSNHELFSISEYKTCCEFIEHAEGFERNCHIRTENIPRFPTSFEEVIDAYV